MQEQVEHLGELAPRTEEFQPTTISCPMLDILAISGLQPHAGWSDITHSHSLPTYFLSLNRNAGASVVRDEQGRQADLLSRGLLDAMQRIDLCPRVHMYWLLVRT